MVTLGVSGQDLSPHVCHLLFTLRETDALKKMSSGGLGDEKKSKGRVQRCVAADVTFHVCEIGALPGV